MGMGVGIGDTSMGSPTGVADGNRAGGKRGLGLADFADMFFHLQNIFGVGNEGNTPGVITPILKFF